MYNLSNLNDYEFEMLCKDIMEKKLSTNLHRFAKGKDGGVDLCDSRKPLKHMIQVKHYINSKYSDLRTTLKKEIEKVEKENPENYYVCCSIELLPQQRREIFSFFSDYMKDMSFILDKTDIDDFLSKAENKEIVDKNYKLWLCSTNVLSLVQNQNVFIDCNEILNDIEKYNKLFVTTNAYYECRNKLLEKNIIIITGAPGVGKSTISKMLLLFFANEKYIVRYVSDNSIKDIKNVLNQEPTQKEIILLDDFLGQHYLKLNEKQPNELNALISYVERNPNKKVIMNSRITIINEAHSSSINFAKLIDEYEKDNYLIDLDKMSPLEKAQILYNHIYFNELPIEYFSKIKENKIYASIIKHENYNPRIIEYITNPKNYLSIAPDDYRKYIFEKLNNPDGVWEDEYRNRLEENDRMLLNTLYSLTNTKIEISILRDAFNKRLMALSPNTTLNIFEEVINRLTNSLLKIVIEKDKQYISVVNPSVNDYLSKKIERNEVEQNAIIDNAYYIEQLKKLKQNKNKIIEFFNSNQITKLVSVDNKVEYGYLDLLIECEIKNLNLLQQVQSIFSKLCSECYCGYGDTIVELIEKNYVDYYELQTFIINNLENVTKHFLFDNLVFLYNWHKSIDNDMKDSDNTIYRSSFAQAIQDNVMDSVNEEIQEIVDNEMNNFPLEIDIPDEINIDELKEVYVDEYYPFVKEVVTNDINNKLKEMIGKTPININITHIDFDYIFYNINIDDAIKSHVDNEETDARIQQYVDDYEFHQPTPSDWDIIDKIFN